MIGQIFSYALFAFMCIMGGGSSIFVVLGIPAVILWKIYRTIRYHENLLG